MSAAPSSIPEKFDPTAIEEKWRQVWDESGIYRWDPNSPRANTFVVDTPPPTASGSLHVGHVFSYTQTDVIVRQQRMLGKNIFYPMGWDDNGLPTERRVQNYLNICCEPGLAYDPNWKPNPQAGQTKEKGQRQTPVSRRNFIEACDVVTKQDEAVFERLFRRLGLSLDWTLQYATIDSHCRRISQTAFLNLCKKGLAYQSEAPTVWDVDFRSAIAQAEIEDREAPGAFHDIRFGVEGGGEFTIATTRPELIPACIAVVAHPSDARYQHLFGKKAITPLFHAPVPIMAAEHADPEKGTGILMVCTFGDIMDVEWWKQSKLPAKQIINIEGRIIDINHGPAPFISANPAAADESFKQLVGLTVKQAQKKIVELLAQEGSAYERGRALVGDPKPINHVVKFYEKGERPLEFITTRQWFIKILDHKKQLLEQGRKVQWHPGYMLTRYEHWVNGLNQDWCISRQRYFGVPFPVWYPIDKSGHVNYAEPIYAAVDMLPVDPLSDVPPGYTAEQRDLPGGFKGDPDVMDTWATSALTPQIQSHWSIDEKRHKSLFPMDLRPQAHDIIRTWAFSTIVQAWHQEGQIPWKHAAISGWILDPDRKKMSKSKGNTVTPEHLLDQHSSDAVRYWSARARLGVDTAFDEKLFTIGRKLSTKLFNASRFVLLQFERVGLTPGSVNVSDISDELDLAFVNRLRLVVDQATKSYADFDYAAALQQTEDLFWNYCDHYLEMVKVRSYADIDNAGRRSAFATLSWTLKTFLRLFAPVLPYITEEVWSWAFSGEGREKYIHTARWPDIQEVSAVQGPRFSKSFDAAVEVIGKIRGAKTSAQRGQKTGVSHLAVKGKSESLAALKSVLADVVHAGSVAEAGVVLTEGEPTGVELFEIEVALASD